MIWLTALDRLEKIALCTGYHIIGESVTEVPGDCADLEQITPHYEWFEGWPSPPAVARTSEKLPKGARTYLDRIEEQLESPIRYLSVGMRRDQSIGLQSPTLRR